MVIRTSILKNLIKNSELSTANDKKTPNFFRKKRVTVNTKWIVRLNGKTLSKEMNSPDECYDFITENNLQNKQTTIDVIQ